MSHKLGYGLGYLEAPLVTLSDNYAWLVELRFLIHRGASGVEIRQQNHGKMNPVPPQTL
jgi:hypothetical protein